MALDQLGIGNATRTEDELRSNWELIYLNNSWRCLLVAVRKSVK